MKYIILKDTTVSTFINNGILVKEAIHFLKGNVINVTHIENDRYIWNDGCYSHFPEGSIKKY